MKINITFFIQVINFFVTYYMLHVLLFRPLLAVITKERNHEHGLRVNLKEILSRVRARKREKRESLAAFQQNFEESFVLEELSSPSIDSDVGYKKDKEYIDSEIQRAKTLIVSRLPHVD